MIATGVLRYNFEFTTRIGFKQPKTKIFLANFSKSRQPCSTVSDGGEECCVCDARSTEWAQNKVGAYVDTCRESF